MRHRVTWLLLPLVVLVAISLGCSGSSPTANLERTAGDSIRDATTTMRIKTTYLFNGHLNPFRINVDTRDGVVNLSGTVPSDVHKDLAGEIAKNADGVKEVNNDLRIADSGATAPDESDRSFEQAVRDATITASVKMSLALGRGVRATGVNVDTRGGTVTLTGQVSSEAERQLAAKTAQDVDGVRGVVNQLQVRG
jgi:hyperosmotically inducible periplasmic protein